MCNLITFTYIDAHSVIKKQRKTAFVFILILAENPNVSPNKQ